MVRKIKPLKRPSIDPDDDLAFDPAGDSELDLELLKGNESILKAFGKGLFQILKLDDIPDEAPAAPELSELSLDETDIGDLCGAPNAMRGLDLFMRGSV